MTLCTLTKSTSSDGSRVHSASLVIRTTVRSIYPQPHDGISFKNTVLPQKLSRRVCEPQFSHKDTASTCLLRVFLQSVSRTLVMYL
jgi:hypothetical protein